MLEQLPGQQAYLNLPTADLSPKKVSFKCHFGTRELVRGVVWCGTTGYKDMQTGPDFSNLNLHVC